MLMGTFRVANVPKVSLKKYETRKSQIHGRTIEARETRGQSKEGMFGRDKGVEAQDAQTHTVKWLDSWWTRQGSTKAADRSLRR